MNEIIGKYTAKDIKEKNGDIINKEPAFDITEEQLK